MKGQKWLLASSPEDSEYASPTRDRSLRIKDYERPCSEDLIHKQKSQRPHCDQPEEARRQVLEQIQRSGETERSSLLSKVGLPSDMATDPGTSRQRGWRKHRN